MSHRKTHILAPSLMYKEDLFALESLLRGLVPSKGYDFQIRGIEHGHELSCKPYHCLDELFSEKNLPQQLDQLTIDTREVSEEGVLLHSTRIHLDKRVSDIQLFCEHDEEWLENISAKLKEFFKPRRPWYWYLGLSVPPVFNLSLGLALLMTAFIIVTKVNQALIFPLILVFSGGIYMALGVARVIFRHARICLFEREEERRPNFELLAIVNHLTILLTSIAGTVIMISEQL